MIRSLRVVAASIAALCSLSVISHPVFAQKPSPSPAAKTGKKEPGKTNKPTPKKTPMRDPKTGKFVKASPSPAPKMNKKTPARDPKTGRFIKSSPTPAPVKKG